MRKSAVLVLNPPLSLVIINYIFVQEGINATYCLSSFEVKKAQTCNNFCAVLLIEGGKRGACGRRRFRRVSVPSFPLAPPQPVQPHRTTAIISRQGTPGTCRRRLRLGPEVTSWNYNAT